ncbi:hypothetical protein [Pseudoroseomonas sp. WGS1072]|uniref:hypothetical protein n=1 Tax=Roseomonas sp. WGS1072 TaxID=3366816 RepID=UPI003BF09F44
MNRLKAMLDEPPQTTFNVTQTFALFSSVLLWTRTGHGLRGTAGSAGNGRTMPITAPMMCG